MTQLRRRKPFSCLHVVVVITATLMAATTRSSAEEPNPQRKTPLQVVEAYVDAANRGDLEGFLALYAPNITKFRFPGTKASEGRDHMREVYTRSFAEKKAIHVEIACAVTLADKVVCRDRVTGLPDGKSADELTVYQVIGRFLIG